MTPEQHIDSLLIHYAAGRLTAAESLVIAAHVAMNQTAREKVSHYESLGAQMMCAEAPAPVEDDCLSAVLKRIEDCTLAAEEPLQKTEDCLDIPGFIYTMIGDNCRQSAIVWSRAARGVDMAALNVCSPQPCRRKLRLMRMQPQAVTPSHKHRGREITLVLSGSFQDQTGSYRKGDILMIEDSAWAHAPEAGPEGCLCLTLTDAPLHFEHPLQRLLNAFLRV